MPRTASMSLVPACVLAAGDYLTVPDEARDVVAASRRHTARPAPPRVADDRGDTVALLEDDLLDLRAELRQGVDPVLVVEPERVASADDAGVVRGGLDRPPLDVGVPELGRGIHTAALEGAEVSAYHVRALGRHRTSIATGTRRPRAG